MSAILQLKPGLWRWDGTDADHGFPIVGFVVQIPDGILLIDPPGTTASAEELRALGTPSAAIITGRWHVRGTPRWTRELGIPVYGPASAAAELAEEGVSLTGSLDDGDVYPSTDWSVVRLHAEEGERVFDEIALVNRDARTLIVGDLLCLGDDGEVAMPPVVFTGMHAHSIEPVLRRVIQLEPKLLLSSHLGEKEDATELLGELLRRSG